MDNENNYYNGRETDGQYYSGGLSYESSARSSADIENELRKTIQRQKKTMFRLMEKINRMRIVCIVLAVLIAAETILLWGNSVGRNNPEPPKVAESTQSAEVSQNQNDDGATVTDDYANEDEVNTILSKMSLEEKICQMIFATPEVLTGYEAVTAAGESTQKVLEKLPVGGVIYSSKNLEDRSQLKTMLSNVRNYSELGIFLAISEEGGAGTTIAKKTDVSTIETKDAQTLGSDNDKTATEENYKTIAKELRTLGFNVNLAPLARISSASEDKYAVRSFGTDAKRVSDMVSAAVGGMDSVGLGSAVKYFPGIDIADSVSADGLRSGEFLPFKAAIDGGADFIIMSNSPCKALTGDKTPCSLSPAAIKALRDELGFDGVIVTDYLSDISTTYSAEQAAVAAVKAGADMLLAPTGIAKSVSAVKEAIDKGDIEESAIDESVKRILRIKIKRGIQ